MIIYEDTLQKLGKHTIKHEWWAAHNVEVVRCRLDGKNELAPVDFGDYYTPNSNVVIDTKKGIEELAQCVSSEHKRFKRELMRARNAGYRLVVLTENTENVRFISDLALWENTHCKYCPYRYSTCDPMKHGKCTRHNTRNKPISGLRFARTVQTMQSRYLARFLFCTPQQSAAYICSLLGVVVDK